MTDRSIIPLEPAVVPDTDVLDQPPLSTRLTLWAKSLPWWSIALVLLIVGYGIATLSDPNQREILNELIDKPQVSTDELYEVVYERETQVLLVAEEYVIFNLRNERTTINKQDVLNEETGVLECPADASANCLSQRGTIITYRNFRVPEGAEPDGYVELEGVIAASSGLSINTPGRATVTLANGQTLFVAEADILEQGEGDNYTLACDRVANTDCTNYTGQYVKFRLAYVAEQALLARVDVRIRYLEDGYERTIRPNSILKRDEGTLSCPADVAGCEEIAVTYITYPERIIGTEIDNGGDQRVVRTVEQQTVTVPTERILQLDVGVLVECNKSADARCQDFEGAQAAVVGETFTGELTFEAATSYKIILEGDNDSSEFNRVDIDEETRSPVGCLVEDEGACQITIKLKDSVVSGRIIEQTNDSVVFETVAEKTITLQESEIYDTLSRRPGGCALNNIRGCDAGIWLTIIVTLVAYGTALVVGLFMGLMRVSSNPVLNNLGSFYVELVRGVPLLVLLFYFAFVIGPVIGDSETIFLAPLRLIYDGMTEAEIFILGQESFLAEATIGLAIGYSAFMAEVFRAGIISIHRGQMEAARSLGMSYVQAMRHVVLPQAIRVVLPPLGNEFIAILKDSALISVLALPDLLQQGRIIASREFQAKPAYTMVALVYIAMTFMLSFGVRMIERRSRLP